MMHLLNVTTAETKVWIVFPEDRNSSQSSNSLNSSNPRSALDGSLVHHGSVHEVIWTAMNV